jgi:hypothetical protein
MLLNIITPCCRPENLHQISKSINIPKENYRWIVVFDLNELPNPELIPDNCEVYLHRNEKSTVGHSQRNFALDLIKDGYVYMNDDDTLIHPELWENIKELTDDFISFYQENKFGSIRLYGDVGVGKIDSHNFIVKNEIIGNSRFIIDKYEADGYFALECFNKSKSKILINKVLSTYNFLNNKKH